MSQDELIKVSAPCVGEEEADAVREVLLSGNYVSGPRVADFEKAFAAYTGTADAVAVNTGTSALYLTLKAAGIGSGDEVIVPPLTFFATISAVLYVGATPVFADIERSDLNLSPEDVVKRITPLTRAIIPVHLYGMPACMDALRRIADDSGLFLLEDCAQAHGSRIGERRVGSMGDAGAFSLFATKHMTTGEGGIITTNDDQLAATVRSLRSHGMTGRGEHELLGFNDRMTEMEAAMGLVQLRKLDELNRLRIEHSEYLLEQVRKLPWAEIPVPDDPEITHTYFWCPVMVREDSKRTIDELKAHLQARNIQFRYRYTTPLYHQPVLTRQGLDYSEVFLPNAEALAGRALGLPNHPLLDRQNLDRIVDTLREFDS